ncbi:unnamed protein product [Ascophyllum nodosum]
MSWLFIYLLLGSFLSSISDAWLGYSAPTGVLLRYKARAELSRRWRSTSTDHAPTPGHLGDARARVRMSMSATVAGTEVVDGDTVVVVGASGGIGRLVIQSLAATGKYKVRGLVRNLEKAREALTEGGHLGMELEQGNILDEPSLGAAMKNAACVVACTGTTAFPSARWAGGNTPDAVDNIAVGNMVRAAADPSNHPDGGRLKRFVLLSSVGVERADQFPFLILNAFGVLDAKAKGEETVRRAAEEGGFSYSIVRSGEIKGDPFVTYSPEGAVSAPAGEARVPRRMVSLRRGDTEAGDVNPSSVAATFTQAVAQPGAASKSFTVVNVLGDEPTRKDWDNLFSDL